jgi:hypothetical protein
MAAMNLQNCNPRRHPTSSSLAALRHFPGPSIEAFQQALVTLPGHADPSPSRARCGPAAAGRTRGESRPSRLTRGRSRIVSRRENVRKSEGFDVSYRPLNRACDRLDVDECPTRSRRSAHLSGGAAAASETPSGHSSEYLPKAFHAFFVVDGMASSRASCARLDGVGWFRAEAGHPGKGRGTRLAVVSSRVRFRLGDSPGVEERAG